MTDEQKITTLQILNGESLLSKIQDLHMMNSGSLECSKEDYFNLKSLLKSVKNHWKDGLKRYKKYDDAVLKLLNIALDEQHWIENDETIS